MRRNTPIFAAASMLLASASTAVIAGGRDVVEASFIQGTWATLEGCQKLADLANGGDRNVETVPETLTSKGFDSWEGGCTFTKIEEKKPGTLYEAKLSCGDGPEEWEETDIFAVTGDTIKVTVDDNSTSFIRCDTATKDTPK